MKYRECDDLRNAVKIFYDRGPLSHSLIALEGLESALNLAIQAGLGTDSPNVASHLQETVAREKRAHQLAANESKT
jgi:hypothetical protein